MTQSVVDKWSPILNKLGVTGSKADWLSRYANQHQHGILSDSSSSQSINNENFPSLLPLAMKVSAKTIGLDLVTVKPMAGPGGHTEEEIDKMNNEIKSINREGKIESIIEDKEYEEKTLSDHPDYKGPGGGLIYFDYSYNGSTQSNNSRPQIKKPGV